MLALASELTEISNELPQIPESTIDAIDAGDFGEMCFHRKIAPFQCGIYCLAEGEVIV